MKACQIGCVGITRLRLEGYQPRMARKSAVAVLNAAKMRRPASVLAPSIQLAGGKVRVFGHVDQAAFPRADGFSALGQILGSLRWNLNQPVHAALQDVLRKSRPESGVVSE